jgi:vacuolar-type H+-ATPase subunit H
VEDAKREAGVIVTNAETEGSAAAAEHLRKGQETLDREIAALRERSLEEQAAIAESAGSRMTQAVEKIVNVVLLR